MVKKQPFKPFFGLRWTLSGTRQFCGSFSARKKKARLLQYAGTTYAGEIGTGR